MLLPGRLTAAVAGGAGCAGRCSRLGWGLCASCCGRCRQPAAGAATNALPGDADPSPLYAPPEPLTVLPGSDDSAASAAVAAAAAAVVDAGRAVGSLGRAAAVPDGLLRAAAADALAGAATSTYASAFPDAGGLSTGRAPRLPRPASPPPSLGVCATSRPSPSRGLLTGDSCCAAAASSI